MRLLSLGNNWEFTSVWILILQIDGLSGAYFVAETKSSWSGDKNCSIAKPPLQFVNGMITTDIGNLQLPDNENIWVGYYTSLAGFEYFGCMRSDALGIISQPGVTTWDPGQCFSTCPKHVLHIGVCEEKCYCLDNVPGVGINTTEHGCDAKCTNQPEVACGGGDTSGAHYVSLYRLSKQLEVKVQVNANNGSCYAWDPGSGLKRWSCSSSLLGMCYAGNAVWQSGPTFDDWMSSAERCFMNNTRPTTFNNSHSVGNRTGSQLWTGIIRSWVVSTSPVMASHTHIRYGYLTKIDNSSSSSSSSDTYVLNFTHVDSTEAVLCETDPNISVAVGLSLVVFILAVSIIVTFVVLKKRGKLPYPFPKSKDSNRSQQPEPEYNYPDFKLRSDTDDIHYNDLGCSVSSRDMYLNESGEYEQNNHDYIVLEEHVNELDSLDTEYDNCVAGNTRLNVGINNVYNTLQSDTNATYDRAFSNGHITSANDNTYDTSDTSAIKPNGVGENTTDNIYNKTNETDDDTYNHINTKVQTNDKQDNTHCAPNDQTGGDYDGIYDRTLDNGSLGTPLTDNTYTKVKAIT